MHATATDKEHTQDAPAKAGEPTAGEAPTGEAKAKRKLGPGSKLLCAVLSGVLAFGIFAVCYLTYVLPQLGMHDDPNRLHDYVYARYKSENADYVVNNMSDDSYLVFGSSELYISKNQVSMCPQAVFGENSFGVDMTYVGEAYDQSLWHAIAVGAYATKQTRSNKIMIMVSPQWFFKGNGQEGKFFSKFSYTLYKEFLSNDAIPDSTKDYVRDRLAKLKISADTISDANDDNVLDALNDAANTESDQLTLRNALPNISSLAPWKSADKLDGTSNPDITAADGTPDWAKLLDDAREEGAEKSSTNDYGIIDSYWERNHQYKAEWYQNMDDAEDEFADFECLLDICKAVGYEPVVCIIPCHGAWYDEMHVDYDSRQNYYARIRSICDEKGFAYADFSSCEYEKYFLVDTVHPGWVGWVRIEKAFYDYVNGVDDAFLGGGSFGVAEGRQGDNADIDGKVPDSTTDGSAGASATEDSASGTSDSADATAGGN